MLKNSARNSTELPSVIFVLLMTDMSQFCWNGPRKRLRETFPTDAYPVQEASPADTTTF